MKFKNTESLKKSKFFSLNSYWMPEEILNLATKNCTSSVNNLLLQGENFGLELKLISRNSSPNAKQWNYIEDKGDGYSIRSWSFAEGTKIVYRAWVQVTKPIPSCPFPTDFSKDLMALIDRFSKETGIEW